MPEPLKTLSYEGIPETGLLDEPLGAYVLFSPRACATKHRAHGVPLIEVQASSIDIVHARVPLLKGTSKTHPDGAFAEARDMNLLQRTLQSSR